MPIDPYTPCPGGTGKKVKFCCHDLLGELDKIQRMASGDQRQNCLKHIDRLEQKFPDRPCLFAIKSAVQRELGQVAEADQTIETFLDKHPENSIALAEAALTTAATEGGQAGVAQFQHALDNCPNPMPGHLADVIGRLGALLFSLGHPLATRIHFIWLSRLMPDDEQAQSMVRQLDRDPSLPLFLKESYLLKAPTEEASWYGDFEEAAKLAGQGRWLAAEKKLTAVIYQAHESPALWNNLAVLRGWIANDAGAVEALRKYASLDIPLDDAVEAEALAQTIDPNKQSDEIDLLRIVYGIADTDVLVARLIADKLAELMPTDPSHFENLDEPPPKMIFSLLDRPALSSADGLSLATVPFVLGQVWIYGKQTDREARAELMTHRNEQLTAAQEGLTTIGGDALSDRQTEEVIGSQAKIDAILNPDWLMPPGTPVETFRQLMTEWHQTAIFDKWTDLSHSQLDGKTPREASTEESLRIPLLAAILVLEEACQQQRFDADFNRLRTQLNVPTAGPIDSDDVSVMHISLMQIARLKCDDLTDDQLVELFVRSVGAGAKVAMRNVITEAVKRPSLANTIDRAQLYGMLANLALEPRDGLQFINQAREADVEAGKSPARWLLQELSTRISMGDAEEVRRLLDLIGSKHINEPGVRESMTQMLIAIGAIGPDGQPTARAQQAAAGDSAAEPVTASSSEIWTPDSAAGGGEKPAIWTPGMD